MNNYKEDYDNSLYDNPMVRAAMKALSPEDIERYKKIGQELYGNIDFEGSKVLNNLPPPMAEAVAYVSEGIKSGLHPSLLDDNEKALMLDAYGEHWYKKYGYIKEDLDDIVTLNIKKN